MADLLERLGDIPPVKNPPSAAARHGHGTGCDRGVKRKPAASASWWTACWWRKRWASTKPGWRSSSSICWRRLPGDARPRHRAWAQDGNDATAGPAWCGCPTWPSTPGPSFPNRLLPRGQILGRTPDLAVEVLSPNNTSSAKWIAKRGEYFGGGARLVWQVYPRNAAGASLHGRRSVRGSWRRRHPDRRRGAAGLYAVGAALVQARRPAGGVINHVLLRFQQDVGGWTRFLVGVLALAVCAGITAVAVRAANADKGEKKVDQRVYELRTYYAAPGKMEALHARFRDHTLKLFEKHGMKVEGFWKPLDDKAAGGEAGLLALLPQQGGRRPELEGVPRRPRLDQGQGRVGEGRQAA